MTLSSDLKSINCTSCGAGLNLLGGGRVVVHVCPYCGAELDALHGYKLLTKYDRRKRPDSPFTLGMSGRLMGVDWQIVGTIGLREGPFEWAEHQLYSPTHGYAWLNFENGNTTFSRRVRKPTTPAWIDSRMVNAADNRPTVLLNGDRHTYYETSRPQITYLEGEFTWAPKMDEKTTTVSLLSSSAMLDFSTSGAFKEREVYRTVWLSPEEVTLAFGLDTPPRPIDRHPTQPFGGGQNDSFIRLVAGGCAVVALLLAMLIGALNRPPDILPATRVRLADLPQTFDFEVTNTEQLVRIAFASSPSNAWLGIDFDVTDPEDETLVESSRFMEFYSGRDSDGAWSEGNRSAGLKFRPATPGTYQLTLSEAETELWTDGRAPTEVTVSVSEGVRMPQWLYLLAIGFGVLTLAPWARQIWQHKQRFADSDWDED